VLITDKDPEILTYRKRMFPKGVNDLTPLPVSALL
jgi:methionyl aminopeptidase